MRVHDTSTDYLSYSGVGYRKLALLGFTVAAFLEVLTYFSAHITYTLVYILHPRYFSAALPLAGLLGFVSDLVQLYAVALIVPYALEGRIPGLEELREEARIITACRVLLFTLLLRGIVSILVLSVGTGILEVVGAVTTYMTLESVRRGDMPYLIILVTGSICLLIAGFAGASPLMNAHLGVVGIALLAPLLLKLVNPEGELFRNVRAWGYAVLLMGSLAVIVGGASRVVSAVHLLQVLGLPNPGGLIGLVAGVGFLTGVLAGIIALLVGVYGLIVSLMGIEKIAFRRYGSPSKTGLV